MTVVVVESPSKAKTINKYLGKGFTVLASYGHVRDLPAKTGSVKPDEDFAMDWEVDAKSAKRLSDIVTALKSADRLVLATDPDREGEAISWHLLEVLKKKGALKGKTVERVAFNAITKSAVQEALAHPREVDAALVDAYLARRALDYLVGFNLSPVLWRKLPGARSAGRVQSVALRLVCDRELEIEKFKPQEYWSVDARFATPQGAEFDAALASIDGKRLEKFTLGEAGSAKAIEAALKDGSFSVSNIESKPARRNPFPPFRTSTLQQEASRKLGYSASRTMQVAQRLYEGVTLKGETVGLITYMRTDGVDMAPEAIAATRNAILSNYGEPYLPSTPRKYTSKAKNAQEAHEAIRPTDPLLSPDKVKAYLEPDQLALYELIWKRTISSQMESAEMERTTADIDAKGSDNRNYSFRATGSVVKFDGFLKVYNEDLDDGEDEDSKRLPAMARGDRIGTKSIIANQHFTEPPPRYSEASLTKRLEELGIGRPSTYASIMSTLRDRGYVRLDKKRLIPEDKGRVVTAFLESFFERYVEYDFTADLEEQLDRISNGEVDFKKVLRDFWKDFRAKIGEVSELRITQVIDSLNDLLEPHIFPAKADGTAPRACPTCADGSLSLKLSRFGSFIGCTNYPECKYTRQLSIPPDGEAQPIDGTVIGTDPVSGLPVTRRIGRFGPYLQLGDAVEGEKPKRASIPKSANPATIDLEYALKLLSLPREVGLHPETKTPIVANFGRFGPFILHDGTYANLKDPDDVYTVGLNRAVTLLAEKRARGPSNRGRPGALRDLGAHPADKAKVEVMGGRYGAYVKHGKVNATIPPEIKPEEITLEQALALLAERTGKPITPAKSKTKKAVTAKPVKSARKSAKFTAKKSTKKAAKKSIAPAA
jgi:DNA topoisomerase I